MGDSSRWTFVLCLAAFAAPAFAEDACVIGRQAPPGGLSRIALVPIDFPAPLRDVPSLAADMWNSSGCNDGRFPRFVFEDDADRRLRIRWVEGTSPVAGVCGRFRGDTIELYAAALPPGRGEPMRCGDRDRVAESLAHELGHALGLLDVTGPSCAGRIMDQLRLRADGSFAPRAVHADECRVADRRFQTLAERVARERFETWDAETTTWADARPLSAAGARRASPRPWTPDE